MNRVLAAARLHLLGRYVIATPWLIMLSSLVINLVVFGTIREKGVDTANPSTGGLASLYAVVMVSFVIAMTKQLAFAVGFSLSRKTFLLGTGLFALALSVCSAVVLYALWGVERATGGWGLDLTFFGVYGLGEGNPLLALLSYAAPMAAVAAIGAFFGGISSYWGIFGIYGVGVVTLALAGLFVVVMTYADAWASFGNWVADQPTAALFGGYPWIVAAAFAGLTYLVVRRVGA